MGAMRRVPADDPEGPWIALMCVGVLLTSMSAAVCLGLIVLYRATAEQAQPILALFGVGAVLMLGAAAGLELIAIGRARTHRH
jgi:hypothetical protein